MEMNKINVKGKGRRAAIFLGMGFELSEALVTLDVLRRALIETDLVSIEKFKTIISREGVPVISDKVIGKIED